MDDNEYVKADLEDYANLYAIEVPDGTYGGPSRALLIADATGVPRESVEMVRTGGYQGSILLVIPQEDYLWLVKDHYGSCAGCDDYLAARDTEAYRNYAAKMMRNAYAFESPDDAVRFLRRMGSENPGCELSTFAYGWGPLVDDGVDAIERVGE